jgi:hypothetical protein
MGIGCYLEGYSGQAVKLTAYTEVMNDWVCACDSVVFRNDVTATTSPSPHITTLQACFGNVLMDHVVT